MINQAKIDETFIELGKLDSQVKNLTGKIIEFSDQKSDPSPESNPTEINTIVSSAKKIFEKYEKYLEDLDQVRSNLSNRSSSLSDSISSEQNHEISEKFSVAKENFENTKKSYRKHLSTAVKILQDRSRHELFEVSGQDGLRNRKNQTQAQKGSGSGSQLKETQNVNATLANLNTTMEAAVLGSADTLKNLTLQNETMKKTKNEAENQNNYIEDGIRLLNKYKQRERTDKILIYLGLITFFMTCAYILLKRLFGFFL